MSSGTEPVSGGAISASGGAVSWSVDTPDGPVASGRSDFLVIPTSGGELGVMADHAALVACVAPGMLRVSVGARSATDSGVGARSATDSGVGARSATDSGAGAATRSIGVGRGIVQVRDNVVLLMVESAPPARATDSPARATDSPARATGAAAP